MSQIYSGGRLGRRDFFAVELFDAVPYLVVDFGDRVHRFMLGRDARQVSDGSSHLVKVERSRKTLNLHLDKDEKSVNIVSAYTSLDLGTTRSFISRCDVHETLLINRFLIIYDLCVFTCIIFIFVFRCTHVRMSYVLNFYLLTYLLMYCRGRIILCCEICGPRCLSPVYRRAVNFERFRTICPVSVV